MGKTMKARITWTFHGLHPEADIARLKKTHGRKVRRDLNADLSPGGTVDYVSKSVYGPDLITVYNLSGDTVSQYRLEKFETRFKKVKPVQFFPQLLK